MKPDITEIRKDKEINLLIEKGNEVLRELGYTEHSRKHAAKAANWQKLPDICMILAIV